jgi:hypothetical protein
MFRRLLNQAPVMPTSLVVRADAGSSDLDAPIEACRRCAQPMRP